MLSTEWTRSQEERFSRDSVIEEAWASPIQKERIVEAVKFIGGPNLKVLDVGCGDGLISELIHNNGNQSWGFDLPKVVATVPEARRKWMDAFACDASRAPWKRLRPDYLGMPEELKAGVLEADRYVDLESGFWDALLCGECIEHFPDIEPFLSECHRVLKPGGRIVFTTPNAVRSLNRIAMLFGNVSPWHEHDKGVPHHVRYYTPETLADTLRTHGFEPKRWGFGRSLAEGHDRGFGDQWLQAFSPMHRRVILEIIDEHTPTEIHRHSIIVVEAVKR